MSSTHHKRQTNKSIIKKFRTSDVCFKTKNVVFSTLLISIFLFIFLALFLHIFITPSKIAKPSPISDEPSFIPALYFSEKENEISRKIQDCSELRDFSFRRYVDTDLTSITEQKTIEDIPYAPINSKMVLINFPYINADTQFSGLSLTENPNDFQNLIILLDKFLQYQNIFMKIIQNIQLLLSYHLLTDQNNFFKAKQIKWLFISTEIFGNYFLFRKFLIEFKSGIVNKLLESYTLLSKKNSVYYKIKMYIDSRLKDLLIERKWETPITSDRIYLNLALNDFEVYMAFVSFNYFWAFYVLFEGDITLVTTFEVRKLFGGLKIDEILIEDEIKSLEQFRDYILSWDGNLDRKNWDYGYPVKYYESRDYRRLVRYEEIVYVLIKIVCRILNK